MAVEPLSYPDEIWKPVTDDRLADLLEVSDYGRVRRLAGLVGARIFRAKILTSHFKRDYLHVAVHYVGRSGNRGIPVHILVCAGFNGPRPSDLHRVAHWDGIAENITPGNLRWATSKENEADKVRHQTDPVGIRNARAKLSDEKVVNIRKRYANGEATQVALAQEYGVSQMVISTVVLGKRWTHVS